MKILFLIITFSFFSYIIAQEAPEKRSSSSWMVQQQKQLNFLDKDLKNDEYIKSSILQFKVPSDQGIQLPYLYQPHLAFFCRIEKDLSTFFDMGIDIGVK